MTVNTISTCLWYESRGLEAAEFYVSLFDDARILSKTPQRDADGAEVGTLIVDFELMGQRFQALNGGPVYQLTPAASISVLVDVQDEVDRLWAALLAGGGRESRCGWLTDRFGLSWQIIPRALVRLSTQADRAAASRVIAAMMEMVKIDVATLEAASRGD